ncbi:MAG TPA: ATP-binding protein, partial [Gemmatimonadaceae bacterium]|nr:ATP-binding protein [Gemmatimonadaceae bacterium]
MLLVVGLAAPATAQVRRVVLLYDERTDLPGLAVLDARLSQTLTAGFPGSLEVYREAMDLSRFRSNRYRPLLQDYLRAKYAGKKIDVVIAALSPSLDFMLAHGSAVFPGAAVVFCGIDRRELGTRRLPPNFTGVFLKREFAPTLSLALQLQPDTRHIMVVAGSTEFDRRLVDDARAEFASVPSPLIEYLVGLPMPVLLDTLARLPPQTIVLYSTMFADGAGRPFVTHEIAELVARTSIAPVYAFFDQYLGRGIVGGHLYSIDAHGEEAARIALRVLGGELPSAIPPVEPAASIDMFDWRQLRRWGIDEKRLPAQAVVRYRDVSSWARYRTTIMVTAVVLLLQSLLIAALLFERYKRRRVQGALRESEARAQIAGLSLGVGFWSWEPDSDRIWISDQCARLLGFGSGAEIPFRAFLEAVRPRTGGPLDDAFERSLRESAPFEGEWSITLGGGAGTRWVAGAVRASSDRRIKRRVTGALIDVTERHAAEHVAVQQRRELAHLGRVALLGELSAALAHELNQPLMAILTNTSAAKHLLESENLENAELRSILEDIAADDKRAAAVIHHVRSLINKDEAVLEVLSVNAVVEAVLQLLRTDIQHRGVVVSTCLCTPAPLVLTDGVQLQQVLLNLIMNACDAMSGTPPGERLLVVSTKTDNDARIEVRDCGSGIASAALASIFEPFVTTKRDGLGLGLSICRSIVVAHGGRMWAVNNPERGATFVVSL